MSAPNQQPHAHPAQPTAAAQQQFAQQRPNAYLPQMQQQHFNYAGQQWQQGAGQPPRPAAAPYVYAHPQGQVAARPDAFYAHAKQQGLAAPQAQPQFRDQPRQVTFPGPQQQAAQQQATARYGYDPMHFADYAGVEARPGSWANQGSPQTSLPAIRTALPSALPSVDRGPSMRSGPLYSSSEASPTSTAPSVPLSFPGQNGNPGAPGAGGMGNILNPMGMGGAHGQVGAMPPTFGTMQRPETPRFIQQPAAIRYPSPGQHQHLPAAHQVALQQQHKPQQPGQPINGYDPSAAFPAMRTVPPTSAPPAGDASRKRALAQPGADPAQAKPSKRPRVEASPAAPGAQPNGAPGQLVMHQFRPPAQPVQAAATVQKIRIAVPAVAGAAKGKGKAPAKPGPADYSSGGDTEDEFARPVQSSAKYVRRRKRARADPYDSSDLSDFDESEPVTNQWVRLFLTKWDPLRRARIEAAVAEWVESERTEAVRYQRRFQRRYRRWRESTKAPIVDRDGNVHPMLDDPYPPLAKGEGAKPKGLPAKALLLEVSEDEGIPVEVDEVPFVDMEGDVGPEHRITSPREVEARREAVWDAIVRKHIPKAHKQRQQSVTVREYNAKKTAQMCAQQARRMTLVLRRTQKELAARQRKLTKEMQVFWRKNEKEERERQKRAEKERQDALRREEEAREARRQQKKLNFLIQQTELYAHFVAKIQDKSGAQPASQPAAVAAGDGAAGPADGAVNFKDINFDEESDEALAKRAEQSALAAFDRTKERTRAFDNETAELRRADGEMNFQNPTMLPSAVEVTQPEMLTCKLKAYQMKGLNWLVNLWESGINGILADEMGLGKTVQSISVLAYLAEVQNIWGPYLVIAPLSTLHNWQQELEKFTPSLKVLPYWGKAADRKVLRKFWARKKLYTKDAAFHVLITSYQIVAQDEKYFQKIKWQYMILDEAQAIKSSDSLRWKQLQKLHARNRLLLTGTPIQNSMQELWALLHFIMPTLFDSHEEFSEWFSKDIEGSAQDMNTLNEHQLKRLHMILRPFMLRRVKRDVENELGEKVEIDVPCALTPRQKKLYKGLREKLSVADLLDRISSLGEKDSSDNLMNLVMQFRKVCNHPELFERAPVESPMVMFRPGDQLPDLGKTYPTDSLIGRPEASPIELRLPRALYESGLVDVGGIGSAPVGDPSRGKVLDHLFNIFHPLHVTESLARGDADFGFLRFADLSPADANRISKEDALRRVLQLLVDRKDEQRRAVFEELQENVEPAGNRSEVSSRLLIAPQSPFTAENLSSSDVLRDLCTVSVQIASESRLRREAPAYKPMVLAAPVDVVCSSKSFVNRMDDAFWEATPRALLSGTEGLLPGGPSNPRNKELVRVIRDETNGRGLIGETDTTQGFSHIWIPEPEKMIYDSGKLLALDSLLPKLKAEGHRVLIFFQMVRMMDLIEEYLTFRNYQYLRLDGQTAVQERNMMVREFQTNPDVFIFILSTRAGGLGINLTAADTVIFYDSDWNPTVDQQAMDRCHRLGQTRQVTVYRLISIGTIEERILKRAKQKDHVQKVVISGGGFQQQVEFKPRDIAALLLDDDELEANLKKRQAERAREEERLKTRGRPAGTDTGDANGKRKREGDGTDPGTPESTPAPVSKKRRRAAQSWAKEELAEAQGAGDAPKAAPKPRVRKPKKPATPADGKGAAGGASAIPALPDSASGKENGAIQLD